MTAAPQQFIIGSRLRPNEQAAMLHKILLRKMVEAGEPEAEIIPARLYP